MRWYIPLSSSAKQRREMTKFYGEREDTTVIFLFLFLLERRP